MAAASAAVTGGKGIHKDEVSAARADQVTAASAAVKGGKGIRKARVSAARAAQNSDLVAASSGAVMEERGSTKLKFPLLLNMDFLRN